MKHICALLLLCLGFGPAVLAETYRYQGVCDASAAAIIDDAYFIVGNDEDEILSLYTSDGSNPAAIQSFNFASQLRSDIDRESDIEDAARVGERIYWVTSHSRSKKGKRRINRYRLFATDIAHTSPELQLNCAGRYDRLVQDMLDSKAWEKPDSSETMQTMALIKQATMLEQKTVDELDPKKSGLNIEALAMAPDHNGLLIGFRNPIAQGKALVLHLKNPDALLAGREQRASFSAPVYIDLDGLGLRSMTYDPAAKSYFIIAGPRDNGGPFKLYKWGGMHDPMPLLVRELQFSQGSYPEAVLLHGQRLQILYDEGRRRIGKRRCKKVKTEDRSFSVRWYDLDAAPDAPNN